MITATGGADAPRQAEAHILIVEDDVRLAALLREYLSAAGFAVALEPRGDRAVARMTAERPNLAIVDLMLPGLSGFDICRQVRQAYHGGLLVLTASKAEVDQAVALELGADDYVIKPVEPRILLARIRSLLRRSGGPPVPLPLPDQVAIGPLVVNRVRREVRVGGALVEVTSLEFEVLWLLMRRAGEVVTREELSTQARGIPYDGVDRSIDIHVSRVRQKLEGAGLEPASIKAVRGSGYLLAKR